jgi:uncharacterized membrane protein YhaH (DUF805 family)
MSPDVALAASPPRGIQVSMIEAVQSALSKYATFSGRARRSEYWWFVLFTVIVSALAAVVDSALGTDPGKTGLVGGLAALALLLPTLAVTARRLHDTGRSGWWMLISLVPVGGFIVMLVFTLQDSQGPNAWGDSPKAYTPKLA